MLKKVAVTPEWTLVPEATGKKLFSIRSSSGQGSYQVDLGALTCTCKDFQEKRARFAGRDIRRCCKHIVSAIQTPESGVALAGLSKILFADCEEDVIWPFDLIEAYDDAGRLVIVSSERGNPWVNIWAARRNLPKRTPYGRFGYNLEEGRWSYGAAPHNATAIKETIRQGRPARRTNAETVTATPQFLIQAGVSSPSFLWSIVRKLVWIVVVIFIGLAASITIFLFLDKK